LTDPAHVLDASAVLAVIHREPGWSVVAPLLPEACVSTVNWSEVMQKAAARGLDEGRIGDTLDRIGVSVLSFTREDAEDAASLWPMTRSLGLSLGDRACLALARRLGVPAVTAERLWAKVTAGVPITVIR
jgi:ribonuclease VapC